MSRILTVASGKGGVGKTHISTNLSLVLNNKGFNTCLIDVDLGLANVNILLGLYPEKTLEHIVLKGLPLQDIVVHTEYGFDLIPGSSGLETMANLDETRLKNTLVQLSDLPGYDFFILDCSSGIARQTVSFCLAASEIILVVTPDPTSIIDAFAMLKVLLANDPSIEIRVLVNNCPSKQAAKMTFQRLRQAAARYLGFDLHPLGVVLSDPHVEEALRKQRPLAHLYPQTIAVRCLNLTADRLSGKVGDHVGEKSLHDFWARYFQVLHQPLLLPERSLPKETEVKETDERRKPRQNDYDIDINRLPVCPRTLLKIIRVLDNEPDFPDSILPLARLDPSLVLNIILRAPSGQGLRSAEVLGLREAIEWLGVRGVRGLTLHLATLFALMPFTEIEMNRLENLRQESRRCALYCEALAAHFDMEVSDAYLAGLLSNMADLTVSDPENEDIRINHAILGADLLDKWGFSSIFTDALRYTDEREDRIGQALPLVQIVYLARRLASGKLDDKLTGASFLAPTYDFKEAVEAAFIESEQLIDERNIASDPINWRCIRDNIAEEVQRRLIETGAILMAEYGGRFERTGIPGKPLVSELGSRSALLFGYDEERNTLALRHSERGGAPGYHPQLVIPADRGENVMVRCWRSGQPGYSLKHPDSKERQLVDEQLRRLMKTEALCCFLLKHFGRRTGVLLVGCGDNEVREMLEHPLLSGVLDRSARWLAEQNDSPSKPLSVTV